MAYVRSYDNFIVWVPSADAAIFASQSLEVAHDGVTREDSTGVFSTPVSRYEGDYLTVPHAGPEGRIVRFAVKASRNAPGTGPDIAIDDISAQLYLTPRYLVV
jgi:hypothetical protein